MDVEPEISITSDTFLKIDRQIGKVIDNLEIVAEHITILIIVRVLMNFDS